MEKWFCWALTQRETLSSPCGEWAVCECSQLCVCRSPLGRSCSCQVSGLEPGESLQPLPAAAPACAAITAGCVRIPAASWVLIPSTSLFVQKGGILEKSWEQEQRFPMTEPCEWTTFCCLLRQPDIKMPFFLSSLCCAGALITLLFFPERVAKLHAKHACKSCYAQQITQQCKVWPF